MILPAHHIYMLHSGEVRIKDGSFTVTELAAARPKAVVAPTAPKMGFSAPLLRRLQSRKTIQLLPTAVTAAVHSAAASETQIAAPATSAVAKSDGAASEVDQNTESSAGAHDLLLAELRRVTPGDTFGASVLFNSCSRSKELWKRALRAVKRLLASPTYNQPPASALQLLESTSTRFDRGSSGNQNARSATSSVYVSAQRRGGANKGPVRPSRFLDVVSTAHSRRQRESAIACGDCAVLVLDFYFYDSVEYAFRCQMRDQVIEFLHSNFAHCVKWPYPKLRRLASCLSVRVYDRGAVIKRQAQLPDQVFIVFKGAVTCYRDVEITRSRKFPVAADQWEVQLSSTIRSVPVWTVQPGGLVGEDAFGVSARNSDLALNIRPASTSGGNSFAQCPDGRTDFTVRAGAFAADNPSPAQQRVSALQSRLDDRSKQGCTVLVLPKRYFWTLFQKREELVRMRAAADTKRAMAAGKNTISFLCSSISSLPQGDTARKLL